MTDYRKCDQQDCKQPAVITMVWTDKWQCYCLEHAQGMLNVAKVLDHDAPRLTARRMTMLEMLTENDEEQS